METPKPLLEVALFRVSPGEGRRAELLGITRNPCIVAAVSSELREQLGDPAALERPGSEERS